MLGKVSSITENATNTTMTPKTRRSVVSWVRTRLASRLSGTSIRYCLKIVSSTAAENSTISQAMEAVAPNPMMRRMIVVSSAGQATTGRTSDTASSTIRGTVGLRACRTNANSEPASLRLIARSSAANMMP